MTITPEMRRLAEEPRCPICGYTKEDSAMWLDHHRCKGKIPEKSTPEAKESEVGGERESEMLDLLLTKFQGKRFYVDFGFVQVIEALRPYLRTHCPMQQPVAAAGDVVEEAYRDGWRDGNRHDAYAVGKIDDDWQGSYTKAALSQPPAPERAKYNITEAEVPTSEACRDAIDEVSASLGEAQQPTTLSAEQREGLESVRDVLKWIARNSYDDKSCDKANDALNTLTRLLEGKDDA